MNFKKTINALLIMAVFAAIGLIMWGLISLPDYSDMGSNILYSIIQFAKIVIIVLIAFFTIGFIFSIDEGCFLTEYKAGTILLNKKTKKITYFSQKTCLWFWENDKLYPSQDITKCIFSDVGVYCEQRCVNPITENPKVRNLGYTVEFKIQDCLLKQTEESIQERYNLFGADSIAKFSIYLKDIPMVYVSKNIKSALFEFSEKYSKIISKFYNPEDDKQQAEFAGLLSEYLKDEVSNSVFLISEIKFYLN